MSYSKPVEHARLVCLFVLTAAPAKEKMEGGKASSPINSQFSTQQTLSAFHTCLASTAASISFLLSSTVESNLSLMMTSSYPTNNALLINFRLGSDAEVLLMSTDWACKSASNVKKCVCIVHIFQLSFHFAYHRWWLGSFISYMNVLVYTRHCSSQAHQFTTMSKLHCNWKTSSFQFNGTKNR